MHSSQHKDGEQESKAIAHTVTGGKRMNKTSAHNIAQKPAGNNPDFSSRMSYPSPQGLPIQMVKAKILEGMSKDVKDAIELLNMFDENESVSDFMLPVILAQLDVVEKSEYAEHCAGLIQGLRKKIPLEKQKVIKSVALESENIHGIWVEGDYSQNQEVVEGLQSREGTGADKWLNLIWVYESSEHVAEYKSMACRPIQVAGFDLFEVDFKKTMSLWEDKPKWVEHFLPILDVLLAKKSYVTMSDIMRMIILYYKGGLYLDVKIQMNTKNVEFFDKPMVNEGKLQLVDIGRKENWAMIAEAGCAMIEKIMSDTVLQFPSIEQLETMPVNYSNKGQYSQAHKSLHEGLGPWNRIEKMSDNIDSIDQVNPSLELHNPRPVNSWADDDGVKFDWKAKPKKQIEQQPSVWRGMAENIMGLPPHGENLSPQDVLMALTRTQAYDQFQPDFWAAYDEYRKNNPDYRYNLSPVQVINRVRKERPTRLYIMSTEDWELYADFKDLFDEFIYFQ